MTNYCVISYRKWTNTSQKICHQRFFYRESYGNHQQRKSCFLYVPEKGDIFTNPALASTYEKIASGGQKIAAGVKKNSGGKKNAYSGEKTPQAL